MPALGSVVCWGRKIYRTPTLGMRRQSMHRGAMVLRIQSLSNFIPGTWVGITLQEDVLLWVIWGVFYGLSMLPLIMQAESNPDAAPPLIFWIAMLSMIIPIIYMILVGLYGLWGGIRAWQGKDFR